MSSFLPVRTPWVPDAVTSTAHTLGLQMSSFLPLRTPWVPDCRYFHCAHLRSPDVIVTSTSHTLGPRCRYFHCAHLRSPDVIVTSTSHTLRPRCRYFHCAHLRSPDVIVRYFHFANLGSQIAVTSTALTLGLQMSSLLPLRTSWVSRYHFHCAHLGSPHFFWGG